MNNPIACTLDAGAARAQVAEWRLLMARALEHSDRVSPTRNELVLKPSFEDLGALANLMQREARCCTFFRFTLEMTATRCLLSVEVPEEASSLLTTFVDDVTGH